MKQVSIICDFNGQKTPFIIYIGRPPKGSHPLYNQNKWLQEHGGSIPQEVMDSIQEIFKLAEENNLDPEELCEYTINKSISDDENVRENG